MKRCRKKRRLRRRWRPSTGESFSRLLPGIISWSYPTPTKSFIPVCDHPTKSVLLILSHTQKVIAVYPPLSKIVLSAKRFVSRPAPASPESSSSQVLVRQEVESGEETAINSETFGLISRLLYLSRKCDMFSCFLQFMALVNNPSIAGVRGSPKIPAGSVQESQPVFVLRPFIVSFSAVFNLIRTSSNAQIILCRTRKYLPT